MLWQAWTARSTAGQEQSTPPPRDPTSPSTTAVPTGGSRRRARPAYWLAPLRCWPRSARAVVALLPRSSFGPSPSCAPDSPLPIPRSVASSCGCRLVAQRPPAWFEGPPAPRRPCRAATEVCEEWSSPGTRTRRARRRDVVGMQARVPFHIRGSGSSCSSSSKDPRRGRPRQGHLAVPPLARPSPWSLRALKSYERTQRSAAHRSATGRFVSCGRAWSRSVIASRDAAYAARGSARLILLLVPPA